MRDQGEAPRVLFKSPWRIQTVSEYLEEDLFRLVGCMV